MAAGGAAQRLACLPPPCALEMRCGSIIFCVLAREHGLSLDAVWRPGLLPLVRYSFRCCLSRSRAATAVLTPDSSSPRAPPCRRRPGPGPCALGRGSVGDTAHGLARARAHPTAWAAMVTEDRRWGGGVAGWADTATAAGAPPVAAAVRAPCPTTQRTQWGVAAVLQLRMCVCVCAVGLTAAPEPPLRLRLLVDLGAAPAPSRRRHCCTPHPGRARTPRTDRGRARWGKLGRVCSGTHVPRSRRYAARADSDSECGCVNTQSAVHRTTGVEAVGRGVRRRRGGGSGWRSGLSGHGVPATEKSLLTTRTSQKHPIRIPTLSNAFFGLFPVFLASSWVRRNFCFVFRRISVFLVCCSPGVGSTHGLELGDRSARGAWILFSFHELIIWTRCGLVHKAVRLRGGVGKLRQAHACALSLGN